jgi:hypothetical protein
VDFPLFVELVDKVKLKKFFSRIGLLSVCSMHLGKVLIFELFNQKSNYILNFYAGPLNAYLFCSVSNWNLHLNLALQNSGSPEPLPVQAVVLGKDTGHLRTNWPGLHSHSLFCQSVLCFLILSLLC